MKIKATRNTRVRMKTKYVDEYGRSRRGGREGGGEGE